MKRSLLTFLALMFIVLGFFSCSGFPPIVIPPPDIEITICQNNPTPTTAREDCPNKEVRKYPEGTTFPVCTLDHTVPPPPPPPIEYVYVDTCKDSGEMRNTYCPSERIEYDKKYVKGTEPKTWCSFHKKPPPPPPPDINITICTDNAELKEAREDCENVEIKAFPAGTDLPVCELDHSPSDKKLSIQNGKIYYGGEEIKLCGVSRLEAIWRKTGESENTWGDYSLEWYENQLIKYGVNFEYVLGSKDTEELLRHCRKLKEAGFIVDLCVYRVGMDRDDEDILVDLDRMGEVHALGNVFFNVCNEFIGDDYSEIPKVISIAENLKSQGCIVAAGGWSGPDGKAMAKEFRNQYDGYDIETHHRHWVDASFREAIEDANGKPVVFDEYFAMFEQLSLQEIKGIMNTAFAAGIQGVCYYGFRWNEVPGLIYFDPFDWWRIVEYAGELAKSLNR